MVEKELVRDSNSQNVNMYFAKGGIVSVPMFAKDYNIMENGLQKCKSFFML